MAANEGAVGDRAPQPQARDQTSPFEDLVSAGLSLVIVLALYLDGRAHWLGLPDSFFTVWHALLYGGLVALLGWILWLGLRRGAGTRSSPLWKSATPVHGYGWALAGAGVFAVGGVADAIWHSIFGLEQGIDALLSPSHLALFTGAVLLFSGPVASFRAVDPLIDSAPHMRRVSLNFAVLAISAVVAFALSYLSAFTTVAPTDIVGHSPEGTAQHLAAETRASAGLASFLVTSLLLSLSLVYLSRRRARLTGAVTLFLVVHATLSLLLVNYSVLGLGLILTTAAAAMTVDLALLVLARSPGMHSLEIHAVSALVPMAVVVPQVAALSAASEVRWSPELVVGTVVLSSLLALVLAISGAAVVTGGPGVSVPRGETVAR